MKQIFKQLAAMAALALVLNEGYSQSDSSKGKEENRYPHSLGFRITSGSNGLNQYMMNRLAFGGYMPQEKVEASEKLIKNVNRAGVFALGYFHYSLQSCKDSSAKKNGKFRPDYIGLEQRNVIGSRFDKGAWQLIFRGNEPYLGKELTFGKTGFQQFITRSIYVGFSDVWTSKNKTASLSVNVGLSQIVAWRDLKFSEGTLYTDADRNYVDMKYSMDYHNAGRNDSRGVGYGVLTDWNFQKKIGNKRLYVSLSNFGLANISKATTLSKNMDTTARIRQSSVGLKTLNSADWMEYLRDTVNASLASDTTETSHMVVMPFIIQGKYFVRNYMVGVDYMFLRGYVPRLTLMYFKGFRIQELRIIPGVQFGGFDTYNLNVSLDYSKTFKHANKKSDFGVSLAVYGLEAFAFPMKEHGAGAGLSLYYRPCL